MTRANVTLSIFDYLLAGRRGTTEHGERYKISDQSVVVWDRPNTGTHIALKMHTGASRPESDLESLTFHRLAVDAHENESDRIEISKTIQIDDSTQNVKTG